MIEENNSVKLQFANRHNLVAGGGYRWSQVDDTNFSDSQSAITYLGFNYDRLVTGQNVFRIVDSNGAVLLEDPDIQAGVRKR
jgi:hypothetical protein